MPITMARNSRNRAAHGRTHVTPHRGGPMRVAIIDDHLLFAEGLSAWLREQLPGFVGVFCGRDPLVALERRPDLALLDVDLDCGDVSTGDVVAWFVAEDVPVILVSEHDGGARLRDGLLAGAATCIDKSSRPQDLLTTILNVMEGHESLTRELAELMCSPAPPALSPQELRALRLYCAGLPLKSVARQMSVGTSTAKEYLDRVRAKYDAAGRPARTKTELANAARIDGLLD